MGKSYLYMLMNGQILVVYVNEWANPYYSPLGGGGAYRVDKLVSEHLRSQMRLNPHLFFLV